MHAKTSGLLEQRFRLFDTHSCPEIIITYLVYQMPSDSFTLLNWQQLFRLFLQNSHSSHNVFKCTQDHFDIWVCRGCASCNTAQEKHTDDKHPLCHYRNLYWNRYGIGRVSDLHRLLALQTLVNKYHIPGNLDVAKQFQKPPSQCVFCYGCFSW